MIVMKKNNNEKEKMNNSSNNNSNNNIINKDSNGSTSLSEPRGRLLKIKLPYALNDASRYLLQTWIENFPPFEPNPASGGNASTSLEFEITTTLSLSCIQWRMRGLQTDVVQGIVDFFSIVSHGDEDRLDAEVAVLNEIGGTLNPLKIGSWVAVRSKAEEEVGWFFSSENTLTKVVEVLEKEINVCKGKGKGCVEKLKAWNKDKMEEKVRCLSIGREVGIGNPPKHKTRSLSLVLAFGAKDHSQIIGDLTEVWKLFDFDSFSLSSEVLAEIDRHLQEGGGSANGTTSGDTKPAETEKVLVQISFNENGFVQFGIILMYANKMKEEHLKKIMELEMTKKKKEDIDEDNLNAFQKSLGGKYPTAWEYRFTKPAAEKKEDADEKDPFDFILYYYAGDEIYK